MAELDAITEALRRQRSDLEELMDSTLTRTGQTAELLGQIADLQRRVADTQRRCEAARAEPDSRRGR